MKFILFLLIFTLSFNIEIVEAKTKAKGKASKKTKTEQKYPADADLLIEEGVTVSIFPEKGLNWKISENCKTIEECQRVKAVAWPDKTADVWVTGKKEKGKTIDPFTGEEVTEEYYPVKVKYEREDILGKKVSVEQEGWIEASFIRLKKDDTLKEKPSDPLVSIDAPKAAPPALKEKDCETAPLPKKKNKEDIKKLARTIEVEAFDQQVEILMGKVGQCIEPDPKKMQSSSKLNYDLFVLPRMQKETVPKIEKMVGGKFMPMDQTDLINIDALARTLYGELALCFRKGLQHPLAVSKVVDNRLRAAQRDKRYKDVFIREDHDPSAPTLTQIVTGPSQFNVWMSTHKNKQGKVIPNPALKNALCPFPEKFKDYEKSKKKLIPYQVSIWRNAVRIATEFVLHKHAFNDRFPTTDADSKAKPMKENVVYYTSYLPRFYNYKRVHPKIEGHSLDKQGCVQVWADPKMKLD